MASVTEDERKRGWFHAFTPTPADYEMYARYSTPRLRLLAWLGDTVAQRVLALRKR